MNENISRIGSMMQPPAAGLALARETIRLGEIGAGLFRPVQTIPRPFVGPSVSSGILRRRSRAG